MAHRDMRSTSPTEARNPFFPSSITSGSPPTLVAIAGTSHAIASSAARPKDSSWLGKSMRSEIASFSCTLSCLPRKLTRFSSPRRRTCHSAAERSGPSPIIINRAGTSFCTRSKISITSPIRFTGRKFDRWTSIFSSGSANMERSALMSLGRR